MSRLFRSANSHRLSITAPAYPDRLGNPPVATFNIWAKAFTLTADMCALRWGSSFHTRISYIQASNVWRVHHSGNVSTRQVDSAVAPVANDWVMLTSVLRARGSRSIYVNGVRADNAVDDAGLGSLGTHLNIGHNSSANHWNGLLAEFASWYGTLSDGEIADMYRNRLLPETVRPHAIYEYAPMAENTRPCEALVFGRTFAQNGCVMPYDDHPLPARFDRNFAYRLDVDPGEVLMFGNRRYLAA
jgi:hypothetical protein